MRVYSRLTLEDYAALKAVAYSRGETVSALSRRVLRRASGFFDADREIAKAASGLALELKKIDTNLNQVVYQINREALLLPMAYTMGLPPESTMILLAAIYCGAEYGGRISSILLNVPVEHSTIYRWVQKYAPEIEKRLRWCWR